MKVFVIGRGKVGRALVRALRSTPHRATSASARDRRLRVPRDAELVVLAVRDGRLPHWARSLAEREGVPPKAAVIHVAGAIDADVLAPLRGRCAGIGRAHPLASFAAEEYAPDLAGCFWLVQGDRSATTRARSLVRALRGVPVSWAVPSAPYHAAAALTANGAVGLIGAATDLLVAAGAPRGASVRALGKLLGTVVANVLELGLPVALTGPIRRGDPETVRRHLELLDAEAPEIARLYRVGGRQQLRMAAELGELDPTARRRLQRLLRSP